MSDAEFDGHAVVSTLAGSASLTIRRHVGALCLPILTLLLDPDDVQRMHDELAQALADQPRPKVRVHQDRRNGTWRITCPIHPDLPGRWTHQAGAMHAAGNHLHYSHQETR